VKTVSPAGGGHDFSFFSFLPPPLSKNFNGILFLWFLFWVAILEAESERERG
jgi:hypothetical protein